MPLGNQGIMEGVSRRQNGTHGPTTDSRDVPLYHPLTVFTDGSTSAGTKDGGAGEIVVVVVVNEI